MIELRAAYSEVNEVLKHLVAEDYEKIPKEEIDFFEKYKDPSHEFVYDDSKSFEEQTISKKAYIILLKLYMDYIFNKEECKIIEEILNLNEAKVEKEKEINFDKNPFPNSKKSEQNMENKQEETKTNAEILNVEKPKENIFVRIWNTIKEWLK